jgi:hypothetical protein
MIFLDKFELGTRHLKGPNKPYGAESILMTAGQRGGRAFEQTVVGMTDAVRKGRPVAQTYGLGGNVSSQLYTLCLFLISYIYIFWE